jgi:hypothetical protein
MMTLMEITLLCGCIIERELPHLETCKCGDQDCQTGYWHMAIPCKEHGGE